VNKSKFTFQDTSRVRNVKIIYAEA